MFEEGAGENAEHAELRKRTKSLDQVFIGDIEVRLSPDITASLGPDINDLFPRIQKSAKVDVSFRDKHYVFRGDFRDLCLVETAIRDHCTGKDTKLSSPSTNGIKEKVPNSVTSGSTLTSTYFSANACAAAPRFGEPEVIPFDEDVMSYILAKHSDRIESIKRDHKVDIEVEWSEGLCTASIYLLDEDIRNACLARDALVFFYQQILNNCSTEITEVPPWTTGEELRRAIREVERMFPQILLKASVSERGKYFFIGQWNAARNARHEFMKLIQTTGFVGSPLWGAGGGGGRGMDRWEEDWRGEVRDDVRDEVRDEAPQRKTWDNWRSSEIRTLPVAEPKAEVSIKSGDRDSSREDCDDRLEGEEEKSPGDIVPIVEPNVEHLRSENKDSSTEDCDESEEEKEEELEVGIENSKEMRENDGNQSRVVGDDHIEKSSLVEKAMKPDRELENDPMSRKNDDCSEPVEKIEEVKGAEPEKDSNNEKSVTVEE